MSFLPRLEEKEVFEFLHLSQAIALVGPRQAGKSTLSRRILKAWVATGKQGFRVDLEDFNSPRNDKELYEWVQSKPMGSLIVLDEVQNIQNWQKIVREEVENKRRKVIVSGSSASLLSTEIASSLAGRAIPIKILTLSYENASLWSKINLEEYMQIGGYPECVLNKNKAWDFHKLYLDLTILRDAAERHGIKNVKQLRDLAVLMLSEPGKKIAAKKTADLIGISQPTFRSFVNAFNDAFLILSVSPFNFSPTQQIIADSKHYAFDLGMQTSISISKSRDEGRKFENLVAIELYRRGYSLTFYYGKNECDFIAQKIGETPLAIQVYSGNELVPEREITGLEEGMKIAKANGLLLTKHLIDVKIPRNAKQVQIEKWLCSFKTQK